MNFLNNAFLTAEAGEEAVGFFDGLSIWFEEFSMAFFASYVGWVMIAIAVIAVVNAFFAYKCADIAVKRGYDEDKYFNLGFIFGVFAFIRAKFLKDRLNVR